MAEILKGVPVANALTEKTKQIGDMLTERGITPTLAILRIGERADDLSYERGAKKRCEKAGVAVRSVVLPADVTYEAFYEALDALNTDDTVHGILLFRPLPDHLDNEKARQTIAPAKDVDGCTDGSLAGVFTGARVGFAPCTAQAAVEILDYYGIECSGRRAVVIGRSLVVGRPAAMMLMEKNATVTICHTRTRDVPAIAREADIVIACSGQTESVDASYLRAGQTVIDVGISWNEEKGKLCGDVLFEEAEPLVGAITPVPGGVGGVTSAVLAYHTAQAAARAAGL